MSLRILIGLTVLAISASMAHETAAQSQAQSIPAKPDARGRAIHPSPTIYEGGEIRVVIPGGWQIIPDSAIRGSEGPAMSLGNSVSQAEGRVLLEKGRYTLGIAFNTGHASGVEGGGLRPSTFPGPASRTFGIAVCTWGVILNRRAES